MVKLQLTLKSDKPNFVHALNGKSFKLQPGANTLILEYDDYVSLATALGIKPIDNEIKQDVEYSRDDHLDAHEQACTHDDALEEHTFETLDSSTETEQPINTDNADNANNANNADNADNANNADNADNANNAESDDNTDSTEQETIENTDESSQSAELEDSIESNTAEVETEAKKEVIDYSSWPISRLKSKYKSVTGNVCKLKKDEIIEFLQNKDKDSDV